MITLLGASGYIGQAFVRELKARGIEYDSLSCTKIDYSRFETLVKYLKDFRPTFLINAAGYTGKPNVDACETAKSETIAGNVLLPQTIAHACQAAGIPWGHVSSGCIYSGAKVSCKGEHRIEKDLMAPGVKRLWENDRSVISGFTEEDPPNFSFRDAPCSFYSGTKALAEQAIKKAGECYLWRLRIPFDEEENPRNYLTKIQRYLKVYDNVNSISHRGDFVKACLDLVETQAPYGIYNVTNPGWVTTRDVIEKLKTIAKLKQDFEFWKDDGEFYSKAAKTPRSNCVLDTEKLKAAGVDMRPVEVVLEDSIKKWASKIS